MIRINPRRMFDSQNNNRGGYNVGKLYYYEGSVLPIEWYVYPVFAQLFHPLSFILLYAYSHLNYPNYRCPHPKCTCCDVLNLIDNFDYAR